MQNLIRKLQRYLSIMFIVLYFNIAECFWKYWSSWNPQCL